MSISTSVSRLSLLIVLAFGPAACASPTEAPRRIYRDIFAIEVPSALLATDTLKVGFRYQIDCGPLPTVDVQIRNAAVNVAVYSPVSNERIVCPAIFISARTEIVLPPEARAAGATELRFRQSDGSDSVRVVSNLSASVRAP